MPRALRVLLSLVAVVALTTTARAQNCVGAPSFAMGMARVSGTISIAQYLKTYGGDLALGRDGGFFIDGGGSYSKLNSNDGSSHQGGGLIGYEASIDQTLKFCPFVGFTIQEGSATGSHPTSLANPQGNPINTTDYYFGGSLGWVAAKSGDMQVIPAVGATAVSRHTTTEIVSAGQSGVTGTDNFGLITGAMGFVFHKTWTLTPNVQIPIKENVGTTTWGVSLSVNVR